MYIQTNYLQQNSMLHCRDGIQNSEVIVSNITLNFFGGVPMVILP